MDQFEIDENYDIDNYNYQNSIDDDLEYKKDIIKKLLFKRKLKLEDKEKQREFYKKMGWNEGKYKFNLDVTYPYERKKFKPDFAKFRIINKISYTNLHYVL